MPNFALALAARLVCVALALVVAQPAAPGAMPQQQALIDLEHRWLASEDDPAALESILADDFVHVLPSGFVTKAEQLRFMRAHPASARGEKHFQDLHVRVYGTVGVATGVVVATTAEGKLRRTIFTDVFAYRDGRWQAVNAQETLLDDRQR